MYGGIGRAARDWKASTPSSKRSSAWTMTRPCWCNRASRWACSAPTADAPRVLIANSTWCRAGQLGPLQNELDKRPAMLRPDDRRSLESTSVRRASWAGHLREPSWKWGASHFGGDLTGKWLFTRWPRRHGWWHQPLAAVMERSPCPGRRVPKSKHRHAPAAPATLDTWTRQSGRALP